MEYAGQLKKTYPEIKDIEPNAAYADLILSNIGGRDSEMSAVSLYHYNQLITRDNPDVSETFARIRTDEMRHLEIFGILALQLGADPRLWAKNGRRHVYWSPRFGKYPKKMSSMISNALFVEYMAIDRYMKQIRQIKDPVLTEILKSIVRDEQEHVSAIKGLLRKLRQS